MLSRAKRVCRRSDFSLKSKKKKKRRTVDRHRRRSVSERLRSTSSVAEFTAATWTTGCRRNASSRKSIGTAKKEQKRIEMRCEGDFVENSEKESNLGAAFDCRLVSHPKSALSLDRIPGDSLRILAPPPKRGFPDYSVSFP